jgi:putative salt-induced outer membrane protein YdiY
MKNYMIRRNCSVFLGVFMMLCCTGELLAQEVYLKNNDRITGDIVSEDKERVVVKTEAMGNIIIRREQISRIGEIQKKDEEIAREVSFGYNLAKGNTNTEQLDFGVKYNKNRFHIDELTYKASFLYGAFDKKMNAQKWYGLGRYAYNFGETKSWYRFYRMEADRDRFANIDYRLVPAAGIGYWFLDREDKKFLLEGGLGFRHIVYRDDTKDRNEPVFTPRAYFLKKVSGTLTLSEDFIFYQSLKDSRYSLRSESAAVNAINDRLALRLSFIDEFDSEPAGNAKRNDIRFITSLVVNF